MCLENNEKPVKLFGRPPTFIRVNRFIMVGIVKEFRKTTDFHLFQTLYNGEFICKVVAKTAYNLATTCRGNNVSHKNIHPKGDKIIRYMTM